MINFALWKICFILRRVFQHAIKSYDMRVTSYFLSDGRRVVDFYRPWKIHSSRPGLNPQMLVPMTSTLSTRPPRTTSHTVGRRGYSWYDERLQSQWKQYLSRVLLHRFTPQVIRCFINQPLNKIWNACWTGKIISFGLRTGYNGPDFVRKNK
jgi:hypothetical protein